MYMGNDVEGVPRGEDWLVSNFMADNQLAEEQNQILEAKIGEYEQIQQEILARQEQEQDEEMGGSEIKLRPTTPMK